MSDTQTQPTKTKRRIPFWLIVVGIALLGIIAYNVTGDSSIGQLLFLILLAVVTIKLFLFVLKAGSLLLKIFLVIFVLLAWLGTFLAHSSMF